MGLDQDKIYTDVQGIFRKGLVIIVGSGASSALNLPGMGDLAKFLQANIPRAISSESLKCLPQWKPISERLERGAGLEDALATGVGSDELSALIASQIADCILEEEISAVEKLLSDNEIPAFSRIFQHILKITKSVDVITTNYDRLLEVQAARVGISVDSMFYGQTVGRFDQDQSSKAMLRPDNQPGKRRVPTVQTVPHIRLSKPHGSLDWFSYNGQHYRSDLAFPGARRIVAPGGDKYRQGYDLPFDQQRERANNAVDSAEALLFVGYGFNDDHLQTHIKDKMRKVPSLVLSRTFTDNAREYLSTSPKALGIEADDADKGCAHVQRGGAETVIDSPIWNLMDLVKEVLGK